MLLASGAGRHPGCCGIVRWACVQPGEEQQHEAAAENKTSPQACFVQPAAGQAQDTAAL